MTIPTGITRKFISKFTVAGVFAIRNHTWVTIVRSLGPAYLVRAEDGGEFVAFEDELFMHGYPPKFLEKGVVLKWTAEELKGLNHKDFADYVIGQASAYIESSKC